MTIINKNKLTQLHVKDGMTYKEIAENLNTTIYWVRKSIKEHEIQPRKAGQREGKTHSEETRKKISAIHKGKTVSKETRIKMSESKKGSLNHNFGKKHKHHGKRHWCKCPDGKTVSMRSTWEIAYTEHLNQIGTMWKYEPKTFVLEDGRAYTPDFYLSDDKTWVEVKGWLTPEHKTRMESWKKENPDESLILADKKYLQSLGIDLKKKWITSKPKFECLECKELFYRKEPSQRLCSVTCRNRFVASGKRLTKEEDKPKRKYNGNQSYGNNNSSKLTQTDIQEIRDMKKSKAAEEIAMLKKTSVSNVYNICREVSWK
jgi:hypothetical protein